MLDVRVTPTWYIEPNSNFEQPTIGSLSPSPPLGERAGVRGMDLTDTPQHAGISGSGQASSRARRTCTNNAGAKCSNTIRLK